MNNSLLRITDGTAGGTVDLLSTSGWLLKSWRPSVPEPKGGGVFRDSPLVDGRKMAYRKLKNVTDTFNMVAQGETQDLLIASVQKLQQLLEKAVNYWTTSWQNAPVWIEARSPQETEIRYAIIVDYRLNGFGGAYEQPFFASDCDSVSEVLLNIEHTLWQETEPGDVGNCVMLSNRYYSADVVTYTSNTFYPAQSSDDGTFQTIVEGSSTGSDLTNVNIGVGIQLVLPFICEAGIVFNNVTVPHGAYIVNAILTLTQGVIAVGTADIKVEAQDPTYGVAATFSTAHDFFTRVRLPTKQYIHLEDGEYPGPIDVTDIVASVVDRRRLGSSDYWTTGDDMAFMVSLFEGSGGREFVAFDNGSDYAELFIEYAEDGAYLGPDETCMHEVVVSNKKNKAVISDVYIYDADGGDIPGNWSDNLMGEVLPYDILPGTPAVGDILYLGSDTSHINCGVFNNVVFNLSTAQEGIVSGTWKYWNGASWYAFSAGFTPDICGDALLLAIDGTVSLVFEPQDDWATTTVNGVTGYWIMFEVTSITGVPTPPEQEDYHIYTAVNPYIDIDEAQVPGDLPALARVMFDGLGCTYTSMNNLVMGLRSLSRGENFSAYLNASDVQNPVGVTFDYNGGAAGFISDPYAPTGQYLHLHGIATGDAWTEACWWTLSSDITKEYIGTYHAYLRCHDGSGATNNVRYRLKSTFGTEYNISYSDVAAPNGYLGDIYCHDLGQLVIQPSMTMRPNDRMAFLKIALETIASDDGTGYTYNEVYDIILIPSDEWSGNFGVPLISGVSTLTYGRGLDIDAVTNPRQYRATETSIDIRSDTYDDDNRSVLAEWSRTASSEPIFQANSTQRMWFLQLKQQEDGPLSYFENCGKVCAQRSSRFIFMRGNT